LAPEPAAPEVEPVAAPTPEPDVRNLALEAIKTTPTIKAIVEPTGLNQPQAAAIMRGFVDEGIVERKGNKFKLVEAAKPEEVAAPKVEFVDRFVDATGLKGFREVCKLLKANEARFREFVISEKILYRLAGTLTAHQNHIDAGRFEVRTGVADTEHAYTATKFTPKGVNWIAGEWAKYQLQQSGGV